MKKIITLILVGCAICLAAQEINVHTPFRKGEKTPIEGWTCADKNTAVQEKDGKTIIAITPGKGLEFKKQLPCKAGDVFSFEVTVKRESGLFSVRLRQWGKEGYIGENPAVLAKIGKEFATYKGEIVIKDATAPDKQGIMRKTNRVNLCLYAHGDSKGVVVQNFKLNFTPKK